MIHRMQPCTSTMTAADSAPSEQPTVGSFRFWFATRRWEWSAEVYRMHGYQPGEIEPTTQLLLAHKHPDDRTHVAETITRAIDHGEAFSSRHRFIDLSGQEHTVLVVADRILDDRGTAVGTAGFYVDLSDTLAEAHQAMLAATLPGLYENRAVIEQAKGVLMRVYQISAEQAFQVLRWRSQETNTKLRALAQQLIAELPQVPPPPPDLVAAFDHILLTVHHRIPRK
ncbi:putative transcription antitermination regulator [Nocardia sputorum]|uniref:Transcription antitermination regulator n=2 Tax=Nocardia sputorum TaxID=2984338 RepID=A0ABM8CUJ8_9NOCA|nr:putative transcription antitermination regulator [Nocardia sputorum]BDT98633.1 putative transcription antitermination regulator [Nocardia sputorum]